MLTEDIKAIRRAWCSETSCYFDYNAQTSKSYGQCAVTALLIHSIYGGRIVKALVKTPSSVTSHYYNIISKIGALDLTIMQFDSIISIMIADDNVSVTELKNNPDTEFRFSLLCKRYIEIYTKEICG